MEPHTNTYHTFLVTEFFSLSLSLGSYISGFSSVVTMDTETPLLLLVFSVATADDDVTVVAVAPAVGLEI